MDIIKIEDRISSRNRCHLATYSNTFLEDNQKFQIDLRKKKRYKHFQISRNISPEHIKYIYECSLIQHLIPPDTSLHLFTTNVLNLFRRESQVEIAQECLSVLTKLSKYQESASLILNFIPENFTLFFSTENPKTLKLVTSLFINLASFKPAEDSILTKPEVIDFFLYATSLDEEIEFNSLWVLSNLCVKSQKTAEFLISKSFEKTIIQKIQSSRSNEKHYELLSHLSASVRNEIEKQGILKIACQAVKGKSTSQVRISACWMIFYMANNSAEAIDLNFEYRGMVEDVIKIVREEDNNELLLAASFVLSELSSGGTAETQRLIDANLLSATEKILKNSNESIRKEAYFILSNVVAGVAEQISSVFMHNNLLEESFKGITEASKELRYEAWHIFKNIASFRNKDFVLEVVEKGFLEYVHLAAEIEMDDRVIKIILIFLEQVLMAADCQGFNTVKGKFNELSLFEWISSCQYRKDIAISAIATSIIDYYQ